MAEHKKLVLIDGHSILHRAFYGVPDLSNAQGLHTNAVYGFLNIMFKILEEEKPDFLAVAFDVHAPTFRHQMYEAYKGTRKPMPEELIEQLPVMKNVLQAMNIVIVEKAGLEADDILGTLAKKAAADGMEVSLVSGDRDLLQISDEHIKIRIPKTKSGRTEVEDYYPEDVVAAYQVTPVQFIDLKALMGDTSDNIPGVPKVGQKTATELMVKYGSLENIYAHVEEISKKSIRESLIENRRLADLSRVLATIKTDSDVSLDYAAAKAEDFFTPEAYELFKKLEFKNMLGRFGNGKAKKAGDVTRTFRKAEDQKEFLKQLKNVADGQRVGLFVALDGNTPLGAAISTMEETVMYALPIEQNVQLSFFEETVCGGGDADTAQLYRELEALSGRAGIAAFDIKGQYRYLKKDNTDRYFDILIAAYLLNPLKSDYDLETIASEHLQQIPVTGHQRYLHSVCRRLFRQRSQNVIRLQTCLFHNDDIHGLQHIFHHRQLFYQLLRHRLSRTLVGFIHLMAESRGVHIKCHRKKIRLLLLQNFKHDIQKSIHGIRVQSLRITQVRYTIKSSVQNAVAIYQYKFLMLCHPFTTFVQLPSNFNTQFHSNIQITIPISIPAATNSMAPPRYKKAL